MRFFRYSLLAVLTVALVSNQAVGSVELLLKQGSTTFGFSWLHDADGSGTGRNANGEKVKLGDDTNTIKAELDTLNGVLKILGTDPDPLVHSALTSPSSETLVDATSLRFLGGVLGLSNGSTDWAGGYIDFEYTTGGGTSTRMGTFYFNDKKETSGTANGTNPNSAKAADGVVNIAEWGNNWMTGSFSNATELANEWGFLADLYGSRFSASSFDSISDWDKTNSAAGKRLGIDLRATGVVPEPLSLAVWSGLLAVVGFRRRCLG